MHYRTVYPKQELSIFCQWIGISLSAFERILMHLPYGHLVLGHSSETQLTRKAMSFVDSFRPALETVHDSKSFVMFGKGLTA